MAGREYWGRYWEHRANRRRFLGQAGLVGAGTAGLALVGCGGGDDDDDVGSGATQPPSTSPTAAAQPKVGGTVRYPIFGVNSGDPPTLHPYENISYQVQTISGYHYSRLLRGASGPDIGISDFTAIEGDLAQKLPEQPDDLTYVFKLKPNVTFHDKAPMNGRAAAAEDFVATYDFFKTEAINRARFEAVVDRLEATDGSTIKITLKAPNAPFVVNGAASDQGVWFIPVEIINNDQVKSNPVGTGPWVFKSYETGVSMKWDRNPTYYDSPEPYFEHVDTTLIRDPQRILAALQSGELDASSLSITQSDEAKSKLDSNGQFLYPGSGSINGFMFNFDLPPWNDKRVRQALSMSLDRDGYLQVLDPTGEGTWSSFFGPALQPYFMSPKDDAAKFGDRAKYFEKNITEAKALLAAAGFADGLAVNIISNVDRYGPVSQQTWELVASTVREAGFNAQNVYQEYGAYIQSTYFGKITDPNGVGLGPLIGTVLDPDDILNTCYWSGSARHNWSGTPIAEMAALDDLFTKQRSILDQEERTEAIQRIQTEMADSFLTVPLVSVPALNYIQPWMKNTHFKNTYAYQVETYRKAYFDDERLARG